MDRSNVILLISEKQKQDAIKQFVSVEDAREVFCNIESVSRAEWHEAGRNGIKPQLKVTVSIHDYQNEAKVELNGVRYGVYRTYLGRDETIELYLEKKAGV